MIVAVNVTFDCAGTLTLGELNATDASEVLKLGANVLPLVESAFTYERSYVVAFLLRFHTSIWRAAGPDVLSPSASLPGETSVSARIASSMSTMPAPCRWTLSRNPRAGFPHHGAGSALFWRIVRTLPAVRVRLRLEQQRGGSRDVRGGHRGAADRRVRRRARADTSSGSAARCADVRLEVELGLEPVGAERRDEPPVGFVNEPVSSVQVSVGGPAAIALLIGTPSVSEIATTGIVTASAAGDGRAEAPRRRCCRGRRPPRRRSARCEGLQEERQAGAGAVASRGG